MKTITLIGGKAREGKNEFASHFIEKMKERGETVLCIAFGNAVKDAMIRYQGIAEFKSEEGRTKIQTYATDIARAKKPTMWADHTANLIASMWDMFDHCIIPDLRFQNELTVIEENFWHKIPISVIRVQRENEDGSEYSSSLTETQKQHESERGLGNYIYEITYVAKDLDDIAFNVNHFINELDKKLQS